jgi:hypothetical protein
MDDRQVVLAELMESREHAAALLKAKLDSLASQVQELASRVVREVETVLPPDMELLFPLTPFQRTLLAFEESIAASRPAPTPPPAPAPAPVSISGTAIPLEVLRKLDAGKQQSEVLQEFLRQLGAWCGPRAIVVFKDTQAVGWAGAGFPSGDPSRSWRGVISESPALAKILERVPVLLPVSGDALLAEWLPGRDGNLLLVPMMLRSKVVGVLAATEGEHGLDTGAVQLLTFMVGLLLETIAVRTQVPTPSIIDPLDLTQTVAAQVSETADVMFAPEEIVPVPEHTVPPEEMPAVVDAGATMHMRTPILPTAPSVAPPIVAAGPVAPVVPTPPPAPARSQEDQRKHDEAKRFARLLVSEIRLYNEQAVQEGKQTRDIYRRLKEDIDRSQEMYEQRISAEIRANSNYFYDELVRILADGNQDALGL